MVNWVLNVPLHCKSYKSFFFFSSLFFHEHFTYTDLLRKMAILSRDHSSSMYGKFSEKPTFLTSYQGVRNVSFLENFAYVLNK